MHNANPSKIETICALPFSLSPRSPKKALTHSRAPLCGTPRRNSTRVSWAAGFIGQHCRALKLDRHARRPAPLAVGKCRAAPLIAGLRGYSSVGLGIPYGGSPPPVHPPLRAVRAVLGQGSRSLRARLHCVTAKGTLTPQGFARMASPHAHGGRSCVCPLSGAWALHTPLPP